jgi:hypothetical protein
MARSSLPARTKRTSLTDDELLLFDFMFDVFVPFHVLSREAYRIHMNVGYTHRLEDDELRRTLHGLQRRKLVRRKRGRGDWCYGLTAHGGKMWTLERRPVWSKYVSAWVSSDDSGTEFWLEISSPSTKTAEAFLATATETRLYFPFGAVHQQHRGRSRLLYWKTFPRITLLKVRTNEVDLPKTDWKRYAKERIWWRFVGEIQALKR